MLFYFTRPPQFSLFPLLNLDFPPAEQFYYFPSSSSTSSFILYIFLSTNTSTSYRPYIDSRLNFFQHSFVNSETIYNHNHVSTAFSTPHFNCFPSTTTTTTFLFFPSTTTTTFLLLPSTTTTTTRWRETIEIWWFL